MIVVEVTSPSNARDDTVIELVEYFTVSSIRHYLIVIPDTLTAVHHHRDATGIRTDIVTTGDIAFHPPGFTVALADLWPRELLASR